MKKLSSILAAAIVLSLTASCSGFLSKSCKRCAKKDGAQTTTTETTKSEKVKKSKKAKAGPLEQVPAVSE